MSTIKIPITADFTTNSVIAHRLVKIVRNDLNAYEFAIQVNGVADDESVKVVIAYNGGTVTLVAVPAEELWICKLPQLPNGAIVMQFGRLKENFLHRIPRDIKGRVVDEIPNGDIPEPQQEEFDRLIAQLNEAYGKISKAATDAETAVINANDAVLTANEASQTANQVALDAVTPRVMTQAQFDLLSPAEKNGTIYIIG